GEPAERHNVDGLPGCPQKNDGREESERDIEHHDDRAAPVAQEQEHHQAGEHGAECALCHQAADRIRDVRRLVELEPDIHILGDGLFEIGYGRFDSIDDGERGGVGTLGDGNVYGALAVDVHVRGDEVGAVIDGG